MEFTGETHYLEARKDKASVANAKDAQGPQEVLTPHVVGDGFVV